MIPDTASPSGVRLVLSAQGLNTETSGGTGTYAAELLHHLEQAQPRLQAMGWDIHRLDAPQNGAASSAHPPDEARPRAPWVPEVARRPLRHVRQWMRATAGLRLLPPDRPAILHELTNYRRHPVTDRWKGAQAGLCVTVHDVQDLFRPEFFPAHLLTERQRSYAFYRARADLFMTVSRHTRQTLIDALDIPAERIVVTPLASDAPDLPPPPADDIAAARALGRYVIYPAKAWPHKNHAGLIAALGTAADAVRAGRLSLVLTGGLSSEEQAELASQAAAAGIADCVNILGWQSRDRLRALIAEAEMLVFPSFYEGFGMPVLEAMALGCPVACSNTTSLPEVAGDAALLFDPTDRQALARILADVAQERIDRETLKTRGARNVSRFSWDATWDATLDGYKRLAKDLARR